MVPGVRIPLTHGGTPDVNLHAGAASNTSFRPFVVVTLVTLFALITLGGVVRATDSGHDCPAWMGLAVETPSVPTGPVLGPLCGGDVSTGTFIELAHRVVAGIAALLVALVLVLAWRHYRRQNWVLIPAILSFVLIIAQAGLGGAAVLTELPRWSVMSHLAMAQIVLASVIVVYAASGAPRQRLNGETPGVSVGRWATATTVAIFALLMAGSYVANTVGAGQGCGDSWPLCRAEFVPPWDHVSIPHMVHRLMAIAVALPVLGLLLATWQARSMQPHLWTIAIVGGLLFAAQIAAGASNIWFDFTAPARVIHLSLATAMWMSLVFLVLLSPGWFPQFRVQDSHEPLTWESRGQDSRNTQSQGGVAGAD